jgi:Ca-activated chloride channel homolog
MQMRRLAALALIAMWGCAQASREAPEEGRLESWDLKRQTFTRGQVVVGGRSAEQEETLIIEGSPPLQRTAPDKDFDEVVIYEATVEEGKTLLGQPPTKTIRVPRAKGGQLRTRVEDKIVPLPLKHTDVKAQLSVAIGSVTVTQQYHNPYGSKIEAVYVFPLPDDAGIRDFVMQIGERKIRGIIREREEAKRIYLEARRQGHVASLLTQDRPNIFTQAVANIEPGKQIDVQITYFHTLRYVAGTFEFVFPMVVGPRYKPGVNVEYLAPNEISTADIALEVNIDAGGPIEEIASPTHVIKVDGTRVTLSPNDRIPNRDFILRYRLVGRQIRTSFAATDGYFTLMVHPPEKLADVPLPPREMIFVIDCSGSMTGHPLDIAKRALVRCLKRLEPGDTFQIIQFSDRYAMFETAPVAATPENVTRGVRYAEALAPGGGTEMQQVVRVALQMPVASGRFRLVAFMTDGFIGNDREVIAFARANLGSARIFSFGVGSSVNRYLLEGLARVGRGVSTFVTLDESTEKAADELLQRLEHPALTDLRIDWGALAATEIHPQPPPDLFVGRPVILTGRFKGQGPAKIRITGRAGEQPFELAMDVEPTMRHPALPTIWARAKIASLYDTVIGSSDPREVQDEIRRTALQYGLMSDWTAFVAVDSMSRTEGKSGTTVVQPVPVPSGVPYDTTVERKK